MLLLADAPAVALGAGSIAYAAVFWALERAISPDDLRFLTASVKRLVPLRSG